MSEFKQGVLTTLGTELLAKAQAGEATIEFTTFQIGNGDWDAETSNATLMALTALKNKKGEYAVTKAEYVNDATTQLTLVASNKDNTSGGFYITEVGVFARAKGTTTSVLYAIYIAEEDKADWFPAYNSITPSSITYSCPISVANASEVTVNANSGGIATHEELENLEEEVANLKGYVGYTDDDIYGVEVDFANKKFTRLAGAADLTGGSDFDGINAFGGRKRCNLADDGTVNAYYGDEGYTEDGSNGQVMVEQPKFYYKVVPLTLEKSDKGYITRKVRYYVSDTPKAGFKIHPDFVVNGATVEYSYHSAFEGCLYDSDADEYILDDSQVMDASADLLSSIAGAIPASGLTQSLTRANARTLAMNRGDGWGQQDIQALSASQLLMLIEYGKFDMQTAIGKGAVSKTDDSTTNMAEATGETSGLGNASGYVTNSNGVMMVSYRGEENLWGNIWKWVDGINLQNPTTFADGDFAIGLYVADHDFADNTGDDPYVDTGIYMPYHAWSYISAFCYSEEFDWLFVAGEVGGNSTLPVGDCSQNINAGWRVCRSGAYWNYGSAAGAFCLRWSDSSTTRYRSIGARAVYRKAA